MESWTENSYGEECLSFPLQERSQEKPLLRISFLEGNSACFGLGPSGRLHPLGELGCQQQQEQWPQPWGAQCHFSPFSTKGCPPSLGPRCVFLVCRNRPGTGEDFCILPHSLYLSPPSVFLPSSRAAPSAGITPVALNCF